MDVDLSNITLRPFRLSDLDDFMGWNTFTSKEESLNYIKDVCIPHPWRRSIYLDDRSIGFISVKSASGDDYCRADIGYAVAFEYWGKGIATAALKMAVSGVFKDMPGLVRLQALVDIDNKASQRVLEKVGFLKEGVLRKYCLLKGRIRDLVIYSFLCTDSILDSKSILMFPFVF
uniref:N-acetyltransferase domain-containing protein n=1 Tax=Nelumbo nucifera TaxID=4432 RepID=A0A822XL84_NELNU|nr:TPA_asm: hypothetical protein HUJ06_021048 [Nelumbo nucifera]